METAKPVKPRVRPPRRSDDAAQISISLSKADLAVIDSLAKQNHLSRSEYVTRSAVGRLYPILPPDADFMVTGSVKCLTEFISLVSRFIGSNLVREIVSFENKSAEDDSDSIDFSFTGVCDTSENFLQIQALLKEEAIVLESIQWCERMFFQDTANY